MLPVGDEEAVGKGLGASDGDLEGGMIGLFVGESVGVHVNPSDFTANR